jgi:hypothetical protein
MQAVRTPFINHTYSKLSLGDSMLFVGPEEPRSRLVDATHDIDDIKGSLARRARIPLCTHLS